MTDRERLYAAILTNPEDVTLRLAWGDWLDEHGDRSDDHDRAEFIRVQCEIAAMIRSDPLGENGSRSNFSHRLHNELQPRERELLAAHPEWSRLTCTVCRGKGARWVKDADDQRPYPGDYVPYTCLTCGGTGDLLLRPRLTYEAQLKPASRTVRFRHGYPWRVSCTLEELGRETTEHETRFSDSSLYDEICIHCGGTDASGSNALNEPCKRRFVPSPWVEALLDAVPVMEFEVAGAITLREYGLGNDLYIIQRSRLPEAIWSELCTPESQAGDGYVERSDRQELADAIAVAAGRAVRKARLTPSVSR